MEKGLVLAGEAAQAYVTYKYFELAAIVVCAVLGGYFLYKLMMSLKD